MEELKEQGSGDNSQGSKRKKQKVEFGLLQVRLDNLPKTVAAEVEEAKRPFGTILLDAQLPQVCEPLCFFRIARDRLFDQIFSSRNQDNSAIAYPSNSDSDSNCVERSDIPRSGLSTEASTTLNSEGEVARDLQLNNCRSKTHSSSTDWLYGRCNNISSPSGQQLAWVLEVLPS